MATQPPKTPKLSEADSLRWDNDPHALPKSERDQQAMQEQVFRTLKKMGKKPSEVKHNGKAYGEWLKKNPD